MCLPALLAVSALAASPVAAQVPEDDAGRAEWIERHAEAGALVNLCDRPMYVTGRMVPASIDKLFDYHYARQKVAHAGLNGPRACIMALEKYGPAGAVQPGLIAEGAVPADRR